MARTSSLLHTVCPIAARCCVTLALRSTSPGIHANCTPTCIIACMHAVRPASRAKHAARHHFPCTWWSGLRRARELLLLDLEPFIHMPFVRNS